MAQKGEIKSEKRLAAPRVKQLLRKEYAWGLRTRAGGYLREEAVPLGFALRDLLKKGKTLREVRLLLSGGKVEVNGKQAKSHQLSVGLFDVISLQGEEKDHRIVADEKGRFKTEEIRRQRPVVKIVKVLRKHAREKKQFSLGTWDGRTLLVKETPVRPGDSLKLELPSQKIEKHLPLKEGAWVYVRSGKHAGTVGRIKEIRKGNMKTESMAVCEQEKGEFETVLDNLLVVEK